MHTFSVRIRSLNERSNQPQVFSCQMLTFVAISQAQSIAIIVNNKQNMVFVT